MMIIFMQHFGDMANILACIVVWFMTLLFRVGLKVQCTSRAHDAAASPDSDTQKDSHGWYLISWAFNCWSVAWLLWILLYLVKIVFPQVVTLAPYTRLTMTVLSDLNSLCLLLAFYGLSRGRSASIEAAKAAGPIAVFVLLAIVGMYWITSGLVTDKNDFSLFLIPWSIGLAMFAPFALGRAFRLRYGTNTAWILGTVYALLQPFAYGIALSATPVGVATVIVKRGATVDPELAAHVKIESTTPKSEVWVISKYVGDTQLMPYEINALLSGLREHMPSYSRWIAKLQLQFDDLVFAILALMKLIWGGALIAYFRLQPVDVKRAVTYRQPPSGPTANMVPHWKAIHFVHFVIAGFLFLAIGRIYGLQLTSIIGTGFLAVSWALFMARGGKSWKDVADIVGDAVTRLRRRP